MNKFKKLLSVLITALVIQGCVQPENPEISFLNSEFKFVTFTDLDSKFNFQIDNPNSFPINGFVNYQLSINNKDFLAGKSSEIKLSSNGQTNFALNTNINLPETFGMFSEMIQSLEDGITELPYSLRGEFQSSITLPLLEIPISVPIALEGNIPLPKLPEIKLTGISVPKVDFSGITLEVETNFKNTNDFPLLINSMFYQLAEGRKVFAEGGLKNALSLAANNESQQTWQLKVNYGEIDTELLNKLKTGSFQPELTNIIQGIQ